MVGITAVVVSAFAAYGVSKSRNTSNDELSDLTLANIEALANNEEGGGGIIKEGYYNETKVIYDFSTDVGYK